MAEWGFLKIFVGIVLVAMVAVGLYNFMDDAVGNYEIYGTNPLTNNETSLYGQLNILEDLENESESFSDIIEQQQDKPSLTQFFIIVPSAIWAGVKLMFQLPSYILDLAYVSATATHLPSWVMTGVTSIVVFAIALFALSAIIKWKL